MAELSKSCPATDTWHVQLGRTYKVECQRALYGIMQIATHNRGLSVDNKFLSTKAPAVRVLIL